jgi:Right handed beta helix region
MRRLRALVVACWVVAAVVGPMARASVPATRGSALHPIDATGASDVTAALQGLIDRTPDGGVVQLQAQGAYRVEGTLVMEERHNLRIEGNGARIFATTVGDGSRSHLRIIGGSHLAVRGLEIRGANPHAGTDGSAYVPDLEAQHGIRIEGGTDVEIDRVQVTDVHGDFLYLGRHLEDDRWTERVWIHDSTFARSGRQGISVTGGRDIVIEHNTISDVRMATIDLEPHPSFGAENIHVIDNTFGPVRLISFAATGGGRVDTVVVARNTLRGQALRLIANPPDGTRRQRYWIVDNTSDTPANRTPLRFADIDGIVVTGNRQAVAGAGEALVELIHTCGVSVGGNDMKPGTLPIKGVGQPCAFRLPLAPPAAPMVAGRGQERPAAAEPSPPVSPTSTTTAAPTTGPPSTRPDASQTTTSAPRTEAPRSTPASEEAAANRDRRADSPWVPVVAGLLAAGLATWVTISERRSRRSAAEHTQRRSRTP